MIDIHVDEHGFQTVTIPYQEYLWMKKDCLKLQALEVAGVDNWEGYENAMTEMWENDEDN